MGTPHNTAKKGDIANLVLMPGDPLRAKFVAETYLENPVQFNSVRGMLGYTGTYKGRRVSVMGSGMGCGSIGIYSWELFTEYDVECIIRIGTTGSLSADVKIMDVVLGNGAYSESSYNTQQNGDTARVKYPNAELVQVLRDGAAKLGKQVVEGMVFTSDVFYYSDNGKAMKVATEDYKCVACEMESFALFHNADVLGKKAATLLTVSDSLVTGEQTTAEERQTAFTSMMEIALSAAETYC